MKIIFLYKDALKLTKIARVTKLLMLYTYKKDRILFIVILLYVLNAIFIDTKCLSILINTINIIFHAFRHQTVQGNKLISKIIIAIRFR